MTVRMTRPSIPDSRDSISSVSRITVSSYVPLTTGLSCLLPSSSIPATPYSRMARSSEPSAFRVMFEIRSMESLRDAVCEARTSRSI